MQRYYLLQIASMRWFGAIFAGFAILITASNLPWLVRSGDAKLLAVNVGTGMAFLLVGAGLYRVGTVVQRRYRNHIQNQID